MLLITYQDINERILSVVISKSLWCANYPKAFVRRIGLFPVVPRPRGYMLSNMVSLTSTESNGLGDLILGAILSRTKNLLLLPSIIVINIAHFLSIYPNQAGCKIPKNFYIKLYLSVIVNPYGNRTIITVVTFYNFQQELLILEVKQ